MISHKISSLLFGFYQVVWCYFVPLDRYIIPMTKPQVSCFTTRRRLCGFLLLWRAISEISPKTKRNSQNFTILIKPEKECIKMLKTIFAVIYAKLVSLALKILNKFTSPQGKDKPKGDQIIVSK